MGFYDRDYRRPGYGGSSFGYPSSGEWTLTTKLVIVIFAIYAVQLLTKPARPLSPIDDGWFTNFFRLYADVLTRPWTAFQLLTYGFLHSIDDLWHILFNMLGLWIFGRAVEDYYGRREFLTFFMAGVVVAGLVWVLSEFVARGEMFPIPMLGASGGVAAVLILFALTFPHQQVYVWGVLPMPAWVFAILFVGLDLWGALGRDGARVAYTAHLGGAAFGAIYFKSRMRLERYLPSRDWLRRLRPNPKLRVHHPDENDNTDDQVDAILKKIQEHGRDSLTRRERKILEQASREYQKRRSE